MQDKVKKLPYTFAKLPYPTLNNEKRDSLNISFVTRVLHGTSFSTFVKDSFAYCCEGGMFIILNVKDPSNPVFVSELNTPTLISGIYVLGNYAYLANWDFGLAIVDVSNPANLQEVGRYTNIQLAQKVFVKDTIAYISDYFGGKLILLNIRNPLNITKIGELGVMGTNYPMEIYVKDTIASITDRYYGIRIINVKNPSTPTEIGNCSLGDDIIGLCVMDTIAYVTCGNNRQIKVVNIANPTSPTIIDSCATYSYAWDIVVYDTFAYIGEATYRRLEIVNVSNPESLFVVAQDTTINDIYDMHIYGNNLYLAAYTTFYSPYYARSSYIRFDKSCFFY